MAMRVLIQLCRVKHATFRTKHGWFGPKHVQQHIICALLLPCPAVFSPPIPLTSIEAGFYVLVLGVLRDAPG